jgi:hypothetical protein
VPSRELSMQLCGERENGPIAAHPNSTSYVERSGEAQKSQIAALFELPSSIARSQSDETTYRKDLPSDAQRSIGENPERVLPDISGVCAVGQRNKW